MSGFSLAFLNLADLGTVTTGSQASASLAATNLQTRQLTDFWRSVSETAGPVGYPLWPTSRSIYVDASYGDTIGLVSLLSHNAYGLPPWSGAFFRTPQWRVRAHVNAASLGDLKSMCHLSPATIAASTNLTGAVAAVQDNPYAPDGTWLTATNPTLNTQARFTFPAAVTGALPLKSGAGLQTFVLLVRTTGGTPSLAVDLYEGGVSKANLLTGYNPSGAVAVAVTWNASLLSSLSTTGTEIRVTGTASAGGTVEFGAVLWKAEHNGYTYDSGVLTPDMPAWYGQAPTVRANLHHPLSAAIADADPTTTKRTLVIDQDVSFTPYAEAGRLYVGPLWTASGRSVDFGWKQGRVDLSVAGDPTLGGQEWPEIRPTQRTYEGTLRGLTKSEAYDSLFEKLDRRLGMWGDLIVFPDVADTSQYANQVVYGHLTELGGAEHQMRLADGTDRYQRRIAVREYL